MATTYSVHNYVGDGTTTAQYAVNFVLGYLDKSHVTAQVEGEIDGAGNQIKRTVTWITDSLVTIDGAAIPAGTNFKLRRETPKTLLWHDYQDGASITENNLDESNLQNIMLNHEVLDGFGLEDTADAATSAAAALASQVAAAVSEAKAQDWAEELEDVEVEPGKYSALHHSAKAAAAVQAGVDKANLWAEEAEDVEVETGKYSAKHYALKASDSADLSAANAEFPAGTALPFYQATPPTGWTAVSLNDYMLRVVTSGTTGGGTGGTDSPILMNKVPSHTHPASSNSTGAHTHSYPGYNQGGGSTIAVYDSANITTGNKNSSSNGAHSHTITVSANSGASNWTPKYADLVIATKD